MHSLSNICHRHQISPRKKYLTLRRSKLQYNMDTNRLYKF